MSEESGRSFEQSARGAKNAAQRAGRAGRNAYRSGRRLAGKPERAIPLKYKIIGITALVILIVFVQVLSAGISEVSMDPVNNLTPKNAKTLNAPQDENELSSIYSRKPSLEITAKLAAILQAARAQDRARTEAQIRKIYGGSGKNLVIECDSDTMPIYVSAEYGISVGGVGGNAGELAVQWARERAAEANGKWYYVYYGRSGVGKNGVPRSTQCPICNPRSGKVGWQCIGFVSAAYFHGAGIPVDVNRTHGQYCHYAALGDGGDGKGKGSLDGKTPEDVFRKWKQKNGENWEMITSGSLKSGHIDASQLQPGDALICYDSSGNSLHMALYAGDDKIIHSSIGNNINNGAGGVMEGKYTGSWTGKRCRVAMRYTGAGSASAIASGGAASSGTGGEMIAQTAEKYAWPKGTSKKKYCISASSSAKGYNGYEEMFHYHMGWPTWHGGHNDHLRRGACCCHSANAIASEAIGLGKGKRLPSLMLPGKDKAKRLKAYGFDVFDWSGNINDLQRGDILTFEKGSVHHVEIYLGNGLICHGGLTSGNFPRISSGPQKKKGTSVYKVIRYTKGGTVTPTGGSSSASQPTYTEQTQIGEIYKTDGRKLPLSSKGVPQSFVMVDGKYYIQRITSGATSSGGYVECYDSSGTLLKTSSYTSGLRHGNGLAYNPNDGLLYSVTCKGVGDNTVAKLIDPATLKITGSKKLPVGTSGIAYDESTGNWVLSSGDKIRIYDTSMKSPAGAGTIKKKGTWRAAQDITAYNGIIYVCTFRNFQKGKKGNNWIDIYSEATGEYYGGYLINYDEIESVTVDQNGTLVILMNAGKDYIQITGLSALDASPLGGRSLIGAVTASDLEILSAYSMSLGNLELEFDEEGETEKKDGGILSNRYKDISGKPVKTYWFGVDAGKINLERDLASKVDNWTFYGNNYEVTETDDEIHVMLKELPAHEVCDQFFGLKPSAPYVNALTEREITAFEKKNSDMAEQKEGSLTAVTVPERAVEWATMIANDNTYTYGKGYGAYSQCCVCAGKTSKEDAKFTCMPFLAAAYSHGSGNLGLLSKGKSGYHFMHLNDKNFSGKLAGVWDKVGLCRDLSIEDLQVGDIVIKWSDNDASGHAWMYGGGDKVIEAVPSDIRVVSGAKKKLQAYGTSEGTPSKNYVMRLNPALSGTYVPGETDGGRVTNGKAIYTLAENTAKTLYIGMVEGTGMSGSTVSALGGGTLSMPLPSGSWTITSEFGYRTSPTAGASSNHRGIDFGAAKGTTIMSASGGVVKRAGVTGGYGLAVTIQSGSYEIIYGHMSKITVKEGTQVQPGTVLGGVGSTGVSTGNHLHFEVRQNGTPINPAPLLGVPNKEGTRG